MAEGQWDSVGGIPQRGLPDRGWPDRGLPYAPGSGGDDEAQNEAESRTRVLYVIGLYR